MDNKQNTPNTVDFFSLLTLEQIKAISNDQLKSLNPQQLQALRKRYIELSTAEHAQSQNRRPLSGQFQTGRGDKNKPSETASAQRLNHPQTSNRAISQSSKSTAHTSSKRKSARFTPKKIYALVGLLGILIVCAGVFFVINNLPVADANAMSDSATEKTSSAKPETESHKNTDKNAKSSIVSNNNNNSDSAARKSNNSSNNGSNNNNDDSNTEMSRYKQLMLADYLKECCEYDRCAIIQEDGYVTLKVKLGVIAYSQTVDYILSKDLKPYRTISENLPDIVDYPIYVSVYDGKNVLLSTYKDGKQEYLIDTAAASLPALDNPSGTVSVSSKDSSSKSNRDIPDRIKLIESLWPHSTGNDLSIEEGMEYHGYGDDVIQINPQGPWVLMAVGNPENRYFGIRGYDAQGNMTELFVNTSETYMGITIDPSFKTTTLEVTATGEWYIATASLYGANRLNKGEVYSGEGDNVLFVSDEATIAEIQGNNSGRYFGVRSMGYYGDNLMVNTSSPYNGTVMMKNEPIILIIKAVGAWQIKYN